MIKSAIRIAQAAVMATLLVSSCQPVAAVERGPLPAFTVTTLDGTPIDSTHMTPESQYVLLYVRPDCRPCDRLLALLRSVNAPHFTSRVIVIVNGDPRAAAAYVGRHIPASAGPVTWYADSDSNGFRALRLTGMPELIGVKDGEMMWSIAGVLNDAATVESVVRTWVAY
ncbi:MAG: hypothetical protein JWL71_1049 [Acidobacteria bacterium]|nr:hypothetical protein [Acidobacteriota bacterium]